MKNLTNKEKTGICEIMIEDYCNLETVGDDDCNDYCGQMSFRELYELSNEAMVVGKKNKKLVNSISLMYGITPEYIQKMSIQKDFVNKTAENLAKEFGVRLL